MTPTPVPDLARHDALSARAISVIDSFDHIDDMADIGVVLDDLVESLTEYRDAQAVLAVRDHISIDRLAAFLAEDYGTTDRTWPLSWLHTKTGADTATAERLLAMTPDRYRTLAGDKHLNDIAAMTLNVADSFADDLERLLAAHTDVVAVPDTIPEGWL